MEYVQMTLDGWMEMKDKLRRELQGVKQSFVRIGYHLRKIDDGKYYEQDGYKSIAEFARAEYGLEPSTTSRFMSINREYSVDGYSERLRPEYIDLKRSQLEEMLNLPEADRVLITPETPRETIRELKRFNAEEPQTDTGGDIRDLIISFYERAENKEPLNDFFVAISGGVPDGEEIAEIICPSGSRTFKKYPYFMIMTEEKVSIKSKNTSSPQVMTWEEFAEITVNIFADAADGENTWENYYGGEKDAETIPEVEPKGAEEKEVEPMDAGSEDVGSAAGCDHQMCGTVEETQGDPEGIQISGGEENLPPIAAVQEEQAAAEQDTEKEDLEHAAGQISSQMLPEIEGEILEEKTVAPAQSENHTIDIEITPNDLEDLREAYETLAAIAWRYPGRQRKAGTSTSRRWI